MIAGHLQLKKGYWYAVLSYQEAPGKQKTKWIATHLKERGNKKKAEEKLMELRKAFTEQLHIAHTSNGIFFHGYMLAWLNKRKNEVSQTTYDGYSYTIKNSIIPYFEERNIPLAKLKAADINEYYQHLLGKGLSPNSVIRQHANIHMALKDAYRNGLMSSHILEQITPPKPEQFAAAVYSADECNRLLRAIRGEKLETVIVLAVFLGLRRSEILGLRWKAINFTDNTLIINHAVTRSVESGHYTINPQDKLKRKSSFRTLPLALPVRNYLINKCRDRYGSNTPDPDDYICVDEAGEIIKPNYVSQTFVKILKKNGLRQIRFHDLRHSCANLLISAQVPLIEVQQWLGHSNISTTADLYAHLDFSAKQRSADIIKKN